MQTNKTGVQSHSLTVIQSKKVFSVWAIQMMDRLSIWINSPSELLFEVFFIIYLFPMMTHRTINGTVYHQNLSQSQQTFHKKKYYFMQNINDYGSLARHYDWNWILTKSKRNITTFKTFLVVAFLAGNYDCNLKALVQLWYTFKTERDKFVQAWRWQIIYKFKSG